ncbi:hypothetical protein MASR2M54_24970 [Aliarcobacter cryaerophilus]
MPTSSCIKCQTLPIIKDRESSLIFGFEVVELSKKFRDFLDDSGINYLKEDSLTVVVKTSSFIEFLSNLLSKNILKNMKEKLFIFLV